MAQGARLPFRTSQDTRGEVSRVLGKLEQGGRDLRILRLLANASAVFRPFVMMADALLYRASLPAIDRELVILLAAARRGVRYEWDEHEALSREAGVTDAQRAAIACGELDAPCFTDAQRLLLEFATSTIDDGSPSTEIWQRALTYLGEGGVLELVLTIAWWHGFVPTVIEAVQLEP